ncbi:hypothetical protein F443_09692 [Phytophthora nicotianae P1569]|uniref:Uncharacterized protein n=1 Tax=Phytophthora nicotianae P1569 TaxID=1317065 RepID=V9F656_PHYNI|nr:hypothetical protein F443_09692 [Phytophthora nicotianae P1569]
MGDASIGSRPSSSAVKNKDADKKRAALWKKQVKCFKLKDVGKKVDAVRFCAQDERFFREQTDVLPLLMGFLSRTKTPELVIETLTVMHTLLSSPTTETADPDSEVIHPDINAEFMLERSISAESVWKAGEPFINLFNMNALASEIRIKAIEVYDLLLRASVALSALAGEATPTLLEFQSVGSPCSALLGCLGIDNGDLQLTALSCLRSLLRNPPNEEFLVKFEADKGISHCLEFVVHTERRYHGPALDILESFSKIDCARDLLKKNNTACVLRNAIQEAQEVVHKTSTIVPVSGMDASPLSAKDAPLLCSSIGVMCQVFVRVTLANDQLTSNPLEEDYILFTDVIDAMVSILRYDITTALAPPAVPTETPRTTGAAAAAANAALANSAALAALLPFSIDRCVAVISSLGRIIEYSERCKAHAKTQGLLPVLLDCFKVKEAHDLHQVADKLLHLCIHTTDMHVSMNGNLQHENSINGESHQSNQSIAPARIDPQVLCAVSTDDVELSGADIVDPAGVVNGGKLPLVAVDIVLSLLETSYESANSTLIFRQVRWIAGLVGLPGNANTLGERAVSLFLQILITTSPNDKLLFAFLAKCIHAIVLQNSAALEQSSETKGADDTRADSDTFFTEGKHDQIDETKRVTEIENLCKLEWSDEYDEVAFTPNPLTEALHSIDVYLVVAEALAALASAYRKWNTSGSTATDFSELMAAKSGSDSVSGKPGIPATGGSKKKLPADQTKPAAVGEAVMLSLLEKGLQVPKLISQYTAVNPAVCVSLLGLLDSLLMVPSGMKVLLQLAKSELQSPTEDQKETSPDAISGSEWPLLVELSSQMEHTLLLLPVLNVLQSPDTSFIEIEAAVRSIAVMTNDLEPSDKEVPAVIPEPVEAPKSPIKSGVTAAPTPSAPSIPELVILERDRFINAAVGCGALVVLLAFMDIARISREAGDFLNRANNVKTQISEMVRNFITLAQVKQDHVVTKYREKLELEQKPLGDTTPIEHAADLDLPYKERWAKLLDHKFSVSRFGYVHYSVLLLASELALSNIVSTLLSAGASPETASPEGLTPLMIALLVGNEEMVIDLLDARANVDAITTDGQDLTVWNCALVSPVKARVSDLITKAYTKADEVTTMNARLQLDSIQGSLQFLDMCLDAGVDANVSNAQGDFLLHALLSKSIVRRKLRGLDLCFRYNSCYEDQRRLQRAVVDLIHGHSANVNSCNRMGQTPLHLTLLYGYTGIAKILLSRGANPNVQGIYGHLPLHYACLGFCGNLDGSDGEAVEIVRLLLEQAEKYTCVLGAHTDRRKHKSAAEKQALVIEKILEKGLQSVIQPQSIVLKLANPKQILSTISFRGNFLPWHFACGAYVQLSSVLCLDDDMQKWFEANGQARADILRYLIQEWKIDSSTTASDGLTALHLAVKSDVNGNNLPVIDVLLENCTANLNAVHDHILIDSLPIIPTGVQAIYCSGDDRKQAFVSSRSLDGKYHIILEEGQHVDNVAREQLQVISDLGTKRSHSHHYKYLLPMESRFAALHYALQSNHDTLALWLLSLPDISLDPEGSDLPLLALACAACQSSEVVKRLITQQANMRVHLPLRTSQCDLTAVDADTSTSIANRKNAAALHYAVMYDDSAMVEVLLTSPGDHVHPNVRRSGDGFTPLHLACEMENMKVIKLLLDHGASLTQLSSMSAHGVSPLQLLMKFDTIENDKLKELIRENYLRPEMLLEGAPLYVTARPNSAVSDNNQVQEENVKSGSESQANAGDDGDAPSCALLREEQHNLDLFERLRNLNRGKRASHEALTRRLESELEKSDAVLRLFFDLLQKPHESNDMQESQSTHLEIFQQLRHPHECYRQYMTRSQWKRKGKIPRVASKSALEEVAEPAAVEH